MIDVIDMTKEEKIERLSLYKQSKTYTYIREHSGYFYNGFILEINIDKSKIKFKDDETGQIPIPLNKIKIISPSKKSREVAEK